MVTITLENLNVSHSKKKIINNLNLTINAGEFIVIVGPSGSGKSTLLDVISGLHQEFNGMIKFNNQVVNDLEPKKRNIAFVFQDYALYPNMNVKENIEFALKLSKIPRKQRLVKVKKALVMVEMTEYLNAKVTQLSGGQKQRIAIARALATNPEIFLLDEPLSNLDAKLRVNLRSELIKIHQEVGTTTIMVTHDQVDALSMADRIVVLDQGEIMQIADPQTILNHPQNLFVARFFNPEYLNELTNKQYFDLTQKSVKSKFVCFKPSDVQIVEKGITGLIQKITLLGDYQILEVKIDDLRIFLSCSSQEYYEVNNKIDININKITKLDY